MPTQELISEQWKLRLKRLCFSIKTPSKETDAPQTCFCSDDRQLWTSLKLNSLCPLRKTSKSEEKSWNFTNNVETQQWEQSCDVDKSICWLVSIDETLDSSCLLKRQTWPFALLLSGGGWDDVFCCLFVLYASIETTQQTKAIHAAFHSRSWLNLVSASRQSAAEFQFYTGSQNQAEKIMRIKTILCSLRKRLKCGE